MNKKKREEERLEENLRENPYNESAYHELIELYQNHDFIGEENENDDNVDNEMKLIKEKIQRLREQYLSLFIPLEDFWLSWILDLVIDVNNKKNTVQELEELFDKAFGNCPTLRIVTEYIDAMNQLYEEEMIGEAEMRTVYEKAISICGLDMCGGGTIWTRYKEFETEELEDIIEIESSQETIQEGKKRLVNIFRRQLAQPLDENDEVLQNLDECLSQLFVESDVDLINPSSISTAYQTGLELRSVRQPFEENILSDQFQNLSTNERVGRWSTYIEFEIKDNQIFRAQRLYERAVMNCPQSSQLWLNYLYFALHRVKNWTLLETILTRCLKIESCKQNIECWKIKYLSIELISQQSETSSGQVPLLTPESESFTICSAQIYQIFQSSLQMKFSNQINSWMTMKMYCDYFKRFLIQLVTQGSREAHLYQALSNLWNALDYVEYYLLNYYSEWEQGWLLYIHYRVNCEDNIIENICQSVDGQLDNQVVSSKSDIIWNRVMQLFPKSYLMWKAYLQWAHNTNQEVALCRKLYKKALVVLEDKHIPSIAFNPYSQYSMIVTDESKLINPHEELLAQWISFEEEYGSPAEVVALLVKWNKNSHDFNHLSYGMKVNREDKGSMLGKSKKRPITSTSSTSTPTSENTQNSGNSKKLKVEKLETKARPETIHEEKERAGEGEREVEGKEEKGEVEEEEAEEGLENQLSTHSYSIFLKNLPFTATEEMLREHFQHCGKITKIEMITSQGGKSKGMAQLDFNSETALNKALHLNNSMILNRPIIVQKYHGGSVTAENNSHPSSSSSSFHPTTLFVSKIPKEATDEDLRECFTKVKNVEIIASKIVIDKRSGVSKGHGLVQFAKEEDATQFLQSPTNGFKICGKVVSLSQSKFPAISEEKVEVVKSKSTPLPVASTLMSFKPRGLKIKSNPATVKSNPTEATQQQEHSEVVAPLDINSSIGGQGEVVRKNNSDFRAYFPT